MEDNPLNLKLVRDVLLRAGFEVIEARTGEEGVAQARACTPDMILMDLQLPGIDGTQALRLIRDDPGGADIPVVALTAFAMAEDRERALSTDSTATSASRSAFVIFPRQIAEFLPERPGDE